MMGKRKKIYQSHFNFGMNNFEDPLRNKKVGDKKELNNKKEKDQRIISGVSTEIIVWICIKSHRQTTVQMVTFFRTHHSLWTLATLAMPFQSFQNSFTYSWFCFCFYFLPTHDLRILNEFISYFINTTESEVWTLEVWTYFYCS